MEPHSSILNFFQHFSNSWIYLCRKPTINNNNIRDLFEMATFGFDAGLETLREVVDNTGQLFQCDFVPCLDQGPLQRFDCFMWLSTRFSFQDAPNGVVQRVQIWGIRRPFTIGTSPVCVNRDEIWAIFSKKGLSFNGFVAWCTVLLEAPLFFSE